MKKPKAPEAVLRSIGRIYKPGTWFQFPRAFLGILSPLQAVVLAYLMYESDKFESMNNGWFYCVGKKMEGDLFVPLRTQYKVITDLEGMGILHTKIICNPPKRYIWINVLKLDAIIEEASGAEPPEWEVDVDPPVLDR